MEGESVHEFVEPRHNAQGRRTNVLFWTRPRRVIFISSQYLCSQGPKSPRSDCWTRA